jgi:nucleotide-binding universal stress UspA family protein
VRVGARRLAAAFIIVGSRGQGAVCDRLIGSISEAIARASTRAVQAVPVHGDA